MIRDSRRNPKREDNKTLAPVVAAPSSKPEIVISRLVTVVSLIYPTGALGYLTSNDKRKQVGIPDYPNLELYGAD
ncbi:unnamed protein product [Dibothriocephalus latus]|uniref:Uncharacterized protein n=1 Tax=Dibothriocephalus latus TaxID=60516 RepID=A0A3P6QEL3_DIBLA|nr:unnamed protein product [Dibothriocephalus latus]